MKEAFEKIKERLEKEVFVAELHGGGWNGQTVDSLLCLGNVVDVISEVEAEFGNGWIPCSERLPERSGRVLVSYESINDEIAVSETSYDYKRKTFWISPCVIAWMPLPEPFKGV